jgi:hypothetical protein
MTKSKASYTGAYVMRGNADALDAVLDALVDDKVLAKQSPDVYIRKFQKFGVDDASEIRTRASLKPVADLRRAFLFFFPAATTEAQNALLKTLEEPGDSVFFIVTPSPETLLPTIRSRVQTLQVDGGRNDTVDVRAFLKAGYPDRLTLLKPLYEHESGERDTAAVLDFLQALERSFAAMRKTSEVHSGLSAMYRARKYVTDKGSLLKPLLEHVALIAPKM